MSDHDAVDPEPPDPRLVDVIAGELGDRYLAERVAVAVWAWLAEGDPT